MPVLTAQRLGQSFGDFDLFGDVSASIPNDGKIGLVGPNGSGKTTLLLILAGVERPSRGQVHVARGARLGYLPQEAMTAFTELDHTVYDEMLTVFAAVRAREAELRDMEQAMASAPADEALLARYGAAQEAFERAEGYGYETRIRQVLSGLGFRPEHHRLPLAHLSGGQKTRVLLARLLLEAPDLLILDEPTNHLDTAATEWLEGTLAAWDGAVLLVSHDRFFLDRVVDHTWELNRGGLTTYRGNYSAYLLQKGQRQSMESDLFAAETARLQRELEYVRRNIAAQNTDLAKGRLKRLGRDIVALETLGVAGSHGRRWSELGIGRLSTMSVAEATQRLNALRGPAGDAPGLNLTLRAARRGGDIVLRLPHLVVGYPDQPLVTVTDLELARGERVAVLGPNGCGKTTLLRTLLGEVPPLDGAVRLGGGQQPGYFDQAHATLPDNGTVLAALLARREMTVTQAHGYLARYLFRGDDVEKPMAVLSGGERARLALALLALEGANLLLLDEPTNHLDIPAQEVLEAVLAGFDGTVILVSHDRYLVDHLATTIWAAEDGRLVVYDSTYQDYLATRDDARQARTVDAARTRAADREAERAAARSEVRTTRRRLAAEAAAEARVADLEGELGRLEADLQRAGERGAYADVQRLSSAHADCQEALDRALADWLSLSEAE